MKYKKLKDYYYESWCQYLYIKLIVIDGIHWFMPWEIR